MFICPKIQKKNLLISWDQSENLFSLLLSCYPEFLNAAFGSQVSDRTVNDAGHAEEEVLAQMSSVSTALANTTHLIRRLRRSQTLGIHPPMLWNISEEDVREVRRKGFICLVYVSSHFRTPFSLTSLDSLTFVLLLSAPL